MGSLTILETAISTLLLSISRKCGNPWVTKLRHTLPQVVIAKFIHMRTLSLALTIRQDACCPPDLCRPQSPEWYDGSEPGAGSLKLIVFVKTEWPMFGFCLKCCGLHALSGVLAFRQRYMISTGDQVPLAMRHTRKRCLGFLLE